MFKKIKKHFNKTPEYHRVVIGDNRWNSKTQSLIGLIEIYFKKYGFNYREVNNIKELDYYESYYSYIIEINYKDKDYVDVLLNRVFRYEDGRKVFTIGQYERWLKTERLKQKILDK